MNIDSFPWNEPVFRQVFVQSNTLANFLIKIAW
jgi:hypothetical protein